MRKGRQGNESASAGDFLLVLSIHIGVYVLQANNMH